MRSSRSSTGGDGDDGFSSQPAVRFEIASSAAKITSKTGRPKSSSPLRARLKRSSSPCAIFSTASKPIIRAAPLRLWASRKISSSVSLRRGDFSRLRSPSLSFCRCSSVSAL